MWKKLGNKMILLDPFATKELTEENPLMMLIYDPNDGSQTSNYGRERVKRQNIKIPYFHRHPQSISDRVYTYDDYYLLLLCQTRFYFNTSFSQLDRFLLFYLIVYCTWRKIKMKCG